MKFALKESSRGKEWEWEIMNNYTLLILEPSDGSSSYYSLNFVCTENLHNKKWKTEKVNQNASVIRSSQNLEHTILSPDKYKPPFFLFIKIRYETSNILVNPSSFCCLFRHTSWCFSRKVKGEWLSLHLEFRSRKTWDLDKNPFCSSSLKYWWVCEGAWST